MKTESKVDAHEPVWLARYLSGSLDWDTPCIEALVEALDPHYRYVGRARHLYETVTLPLIAELNLETHPLIGRRKPMSGKVLPVEKTGPGIRELASIYAYGGLAFAERKAASANGRHVLNASCPTSLQNREVWTTVIAEKLGRLKLHEALQGLARADKSFVRMGDATYTKDLSNSMFQGPFLSVVIGDAPDVSLRLVDNSGRSFFADMSIGLTPRFTGANVTSTDSLFRYPTETAVIPACALRINSRCNLVKSAVDFLESTIMAIDGLEKFVAQIRQLELGGGIRDPGSRDTLEQLPS